ncbi:tannase and feruloyl esterase-domain-containing protein [Mycena maculata]|uniref:Carboxylic ester hydrolase n=1 Tax=Mycena maculata TaxID=230809 RepID=A0AAD7JWB7_9AGAR|nr:tannase and feruloyl esterase-domain-containing protein [Mycena maculata]
MAALFIEGVVLSSESVTTKAVYNYTVTATDLYPGKSDLDFCNVTVSYTREGLSNATAVYQPLVLATWQFQGRYMSSGGGGFAITSGEIDLSSGLVFGAVSGATDGGFGGWDAMVTDVVLPANGLASTGTFSSSFHEMIVIGQAFTQSFYNSSSIYSYYQGCSEGGREGCSQQRFDGAAIGAPAFRMPFQQTTNGYAPSSCELEKIRNDTITACDGLGRPRGRCGGEDRSVQTSSNASSSVGSSSSCVAALGSPAANGTVTSQSAKIAEEIYAGVHFLPAATFSDAATSYNSTTDAYYASASGIGVQWVNHFLNNIASTTLSLDNVLTTGSDLTGFNNAGGKVIHFHGESDSSVPTASSVHYHNSVRQIMYPYLGFNERTTPRAEHCAPSSTQPNGPFPQNVLESVIDWVENGVNPEQLNATVLADTTTEVNQTVCSFPLRTGVATRLWSVFDQASYDTWVLDLNSFPMPVY